MDSSAYLDFERPLVGVAALLLLPLDDAQLAEVLLQLRVGRLGLESADEDRAVHLELAHLSR